MNNRKKAILRAANQVMRNELKEYYREGRTYTIEPDTEGEKIVYAQAAMADLLTEVKR